MKKIAIFVSGTGEATERIIKLFNEGNRVKTVLVIADDSAVDLLSRLKDEEVTLLHIPDPEWHSRIGEIVNLLKENEVRLIVQDGFSLELPSEILETTEGEMIRVTSPEQAPREVVAALEADLRRPVEDKKVETEEKNPTPESEWADALKIQFTPPKSPTTPPEVPMQRVTDASETPKFQFRYPGDTHHQSQNTIREPMPSTWLIWSVLVTVFCCFIPGIIAIIYSSQVSSRYYAGDVEGAKRASRTAEIWIIVTVFLGVLAATLYVTFVLMGF